MSGVTSRTLRYYDEIGLLPAAGVLSNGYRYYEEDDLLRLQQILVLRTLDLGLDEIAKILDEQVDQLVALRGHYTRVLQERDRLDQVAVTIARTIEELENKEGIAMPKINRPENLFEGFDPGPYDDEARERWPQEWEQAQSARSAMTVEDTAQMQRAQTAAMIRMAGHLTAGTPVADPAVQTEVDSAYQGICRFWTPNAQAFKSLGRMYVDDPRFATNYDAITPGLAEYYRDAMAVYADTQLA